MQIQPTHSLGFKFPIKNTSPNLQNSTYMTSEIQKDVFESASNDKFDINKAMWELKNIPYDKNGKKGAKFHEGQLATLQYYLEETPEKWASVKSLAQKPHLSGEFVYLLAGKEVNQLNELKKYADVINSKGDAKYSGKELMNFADKTMPDDLKKGFPLTKTSLDVKNIILISQTPDLTDIEKISEKVLDMEKAVGNDLKEINFTKNKYDKNEMVITAIQHNNITKTELLDKNFKREALETIEEIIEQDGKKVEIKKTEDLRNNTTSKVRLEYMPKISRPVVTHEIRVLKDNAGNIQKTEYLEPSEIQGVYNIKNVYPNGKDELISSGKIDKKTGISSIKKNMTSLDGTKTEYLYENDPQGNRISDYKVLDKSGKIILNNSQSFEIINENKFISANNDKKYEITVENNILNVQDMKNADKQATFKLDTYLQGDKKMLLNTLKQLPGDELIKLNKTTNVLVSIDDSLDSYYSGNGKVINSGDSPFIILHELGHALDFDKVDGNSADEVAKNMYKSITMDKELNKIFDEEKTAFNKAFPDTQRNHIDYFLNSLTHYNGETGGLQETIAESNAILTSAKSHEYLGIRTQYLQQYFPNTIVKLSKLLNKYV